MSDADVQIQIRDTGNGHPRRAPAPHLRAVLLDQGRGKGTGLGLWVSQGIVQTHGGQIKLRSRAGPRHHLHRRPAHWRRPSMATAPARVLVVDDDESVSFTMQAVLEQEGYTVVGAHSAAAARSALDSGCSMRR